MLENPIIVHMKHLRAEAERLAAERLLEEAKALIDDAKIRVDKDETEVMNQSINGSEIISDLLG